MDSGSTAKMPYVAFSTFLTAIEVLEQGIPQILDKSVWPSFSGSNQTETLSTLKFLGLCDESGKTQPSLKQYVDQKGERKAILRKLLETAYPTLVDLARDNGTQAQLKAELLRHGMKGDTQRKGISFFVKAARFTDLPLSPSWQTLTRERGDAPATRRSPATTRNGKPHHQPFSVPPTAAPFTAVPSLSEDRRSIRLRNGTTVTLSVAGTILGLTPEDREWLLELADKFGSYDTEYAVEDVQSA